MQKSFKLILFLCFFTAMVSCQHKDVIFEKRVTFKNNSWNRFNILKYDFQVSDTLTEYDIYLDVRHASFYPYENLLINFAIMSPSTEERVRSHDLKLRDKTGNFLGEGTGDIWDISFPLMTRFVFIHSGTYHIGIENLMTKYETEGVMDVNLVVQRSDSKHIAK